MFIKSIPLRIALAFTIIVALAAFQNCSPPSSGSSTGASIQNSENLSQDILSLSKSLSSSEPDQLVMRAQERQRLLLKLAEQNPAEVLRLALSETDRGKIPAEVQKHIQKHLEEPTHAEGRLEIYVEDFEDGRHKTRHLLKLQDDSRYELRFAKESFSAGFRDGRKISVKGLKLPRDSKSITGDLVVADPSKDISMLAEGGTGTSSSAPLAYDAPYSLGEQRTLVILVNFQEDPNNQPWTVSDVNSLVFGSVNDFIKENSSQQTLMTGAVAGWYTIPVSNTVCDGFAIEAHGKAAAQAAGYVLSNYDRFIFAFPQNACGFSGMAQVGAFPSSAWIHNSMIIRTVGHEFTHNLGANHAHARDCGDVVLGDTCTNQEYGDTMDIMGYSGTVGHLNISYKEYLGWLSPSNVLTVSSSGDYFIEPNSLATSNAKALKIYKGLDATTGLPIHYYLEYRQPIGFDSMIADRGVILTSNIFYGITVREVKLTPSNKYDSYLLDMTPGTNFVDMKDAALTAGNVFSDVATGITITTLSVSSQGANVHVELGPTPTPTPTPTPIPDTTPPSVTITNPQNGAVITPRTTITIQANASDDVQVNRVDFYVNGNLICSDTTASYSCAYTLPAAKGAGYLIEARAFDSSGNMAQHQVSITSKSGK